MIMKTSNNIIVGFLSFVWVSLVLTLFISFKASDQLPFKVAKEIKTEKTALDEFSVLVVQNTSFLKIVQADSSALEYVSIHGGNVNQNQTQPIQNFRVSNDTLFIDQLQQAPNGGFVLKVNRLNQLIILDKSSVEFEKVKQDALSFSAQGYDFLLGGMNEFMLEFRNEQLFLNGEITQISGKIGSGKWMKVPSKVEKLDIQKDPNATIFVE